MFSEDGKTDWLRIKTGVSINERGTIQIGENGYLVLMNREGLSLEIKNNGKFTISELFLEKGNNKKGTISKFVGYVSNELLKELESKGDDTIPGAIERSISTIKLFTPQNSNLIDTEIDFTWLGLQDETRYVFQLSDGFGEQIYSMETSDTTLKLELLQFKFNYDEWYFWSVKSKNNSLIKSDESAIKILSPEKIKAINNEIVEILDEPELIEESAFLNIKLALYYQEKNISYLAIKHFEKAITINPNVDEYKNVYKRYLLSLGLSDYVNQTFQ